MDLREEVVRYIADVIGCQPEEVNVVDRYIEMGSHNVVFVMGDSHHVRHVVIPSKTMDELRQW